MKNRFISFIIVPIIMLTLLASTFAINFNSVSAQQAQLTPAQQAQLQAQLQQIEQEIIQQQQILTQKKGEGVSMSRDISILNAQIKQAQLKIQAHQLAIDNLGKDIVVKSQTIGTLGDRIDQGHASLADIIVKTNELDNFSLVEAFLAKRNLSDFFLDVDSFNTLQDSLKTYVNDVREAKSETETEKQGLDEKRSQEIDTKVDVEAEKTKIQSSESAKTKLLSLNKKEQNNYQSVINQKQAQATAIRNALFALRDTPDIKFGEALSYANEAFKVTGVRPALLLAVITQESNLGSNIGSCYMTDEATGAGVKASTGVPIANVMKPTRDVAPFLTITQALGRDPHHTLVSCPFTIGYGGAMGPAQFIASTWMLNKDRVGTAVGKSFPDPWVPRDAFMASAIYLSDLGAGIGGYTAERNAACKYYSGSSCSGSNTFYGDQVVAKANSIQANIDILQSQ